MKSIDNTIKFYEKIKKDSDLALKNLKALKELITEKESNYFAIKFHIQNLKKINSTNKSFKDAAEELNSIFDIFDDLMRNEENLKYLFINELEKKINTSSGYSLTGHLPDFKTGVFVIEINFDSLNHILWLGPKQEKICSGLLSQSEIVKEIDNFAKSLTSKYNSDIFIKIINSAYDIMKNSENEGKISLTVLLNKINENSSAAKIKLSRAEFSYLIFIHSTTLLSKYKFTVATRSNTRNRNDFLWIPEDNSGNGTAYAYIQLKENNY